MGSLSDRIEEWKDECRAINGVAPSSREIKLSETTLREHLYKRLKAAYCVADALEYLHSRNVGKSVCHLLFLVFRVCCIL